jgi:NAD(P)-dependent dehydrogenase (short-subunit alcohol dehydrogenase family)
MILMAMDFSDFSYKEGSFLVTGSAGFIGFHLAREFPARGARACPLERRYAVAAVDGASGWAGGCRLYRSLHLHRGRRLPITLGTTQASKVK